MVAGSFEKAETNRLVTAYSDRSVSISNAEMATFYRAPSAGLALADTERAMFAGDGTLDLNTFDMNNGSIYGPSDALLIAQASERPRISGDAPPTDRAGRDILKAAEILANDPHRWESKTTGKCNQFVEVALHEAGIQLPWKADHADCHGIRQALDKECAKPNSKWEKIYT